MLTAQASPTRTALRSNRTTAVVPSARRRRRRDQRAGLVPVQADRGAPQAAQNPLCHGAYPGRDQCEWSPPKVTIVSSAIRPPDSLMKLLGPSGRGRADRTGQLAAPAAGG